VEVIIVARGGGSTEDLAAFNDESLARAVAASQIPVISAVGHETDFTIIDFVADLRAPTPSAAAELVMRSLQDVADQAESLHARLDRVLRYQLLISRQRLTELVQHGAFARITDAINRRQQRLDDLNYRMERAERGRIEDLRKKWESISGMVRHYDLRLVLAGTKRELAVKTEELAADMRNLLLQKKVCVERAMTALEALSPVAILDRGYALVFDASGALLKDAAGVKAGAEIRARLARGEFSAVVTEQDL
jgi:exodeoxyribonuclease VII large subunit